MNRRTRHQFEKVLALADSTHEGEALAALRKARDMMAREGMSFADLARAAARRSLLRFLTSLFGRQTSSSALEVASLRQQLADMQMRIEAESYKATNWRQKTSLLEQKLGLSEAETERWQQLARETVERLSELNPPLPDSPSATLLPHSKRL